MMRASWLACLFSIAVATSAAGQITGQASVRGRVTDGRFPLPEIVVSATDDAGDRVARAVTDHDGFYWLRGLPPGQFVIAAEGEGTVKKLGPYSVRTNMTRVVDIVLTAQAEASTATPPTEALEATAATGTARTTGEFLRELPLSPWYSYADALFLAPGVITQQTGRSFIHGASPESTLVFIDGFEMNSNRQAGTGYTQLGVQAVEDIEVKTAAMDASVPLTQAAVLNVTAKSGSNKAHGIAGIAAAGLTWMANNDPMQAASAGAQFFQPELSVGAPILRDRLWLFGSGVAGTQVMRSSISAQQAEIMGALQPGWTAEEPSMSSLSGLIKITGQLSSKHQLAAFVQADGATTSASSASTGATLDTTAGGPAYGARWSAAWPGFLLTQASITYNEKSVGVDSPKSGTTALRVYRNVVTTSYGMSGTDLLGTLNGSTSCCMHEPASKLTLSADLTWFRPSGRASHEIGLGVYLQPRLRWQRVVQFNNNGFHLEDAVLRDPTDPSAGFVPFGRVIYDQASAPMTNLAGGDNALYLQDRWQAMDRLTLVAGLRVDWINETDRLSGQRLLDSRAIGPRVSAAFRLTPRDIVRGGWGRVHESLAASRYVPPPEQSIGAHQLFDTDLDGVFETDQYYNGGIKPDSTWISVHRSQPYVNEWTMDYSRQLGRRASIGVELVRREFRAMPLKYVAPVTFAPSTTVGTWAAQSLLTADTWNYPVVTDLTVRATTHAGPVQFGGSYTYNFRHIAGTWAPNDPASIEQPGAFPNDKGIGVTSVATANSLTGYADTSNGAWLDHSLRVAAVWTAPLGFAVAGYYQVQSGPWSGPIVVAADTSGPWSTPVQFAQATRGDGQVRLGPLHLLNLRASYRVRSEGVTIESAVDVFNPFNWAAFTVFQPGANYAGTPMFGVGTARQRPRSAQASLRVLF